VQLIAKAGLAEADLASYTSAALIEPDRSGKRKHRLLSWLSMNYTQGQSHHSLHLGFVCTQDTDKHIFSLHIHLYMVFTENEYFALHKCIAIVVYISKYVVLFLMADFIRQP